MTGYIAVLAYTEGEWREVLLSPDQRDSVHGFLGQLFCDCPVPVSINTLPLDAMPRWIHEDELPEGYPYETMFDRSKIIDGVRMYPSA